MRILELFAGYGSQAMAIKRLGFNVVSDISEIDKYAIDAYNQLHGKTFNYGDICKIDETKLPKYDLITYSSPCQDFSVAGLQKGGEKGSGTRSSLLWECERIIRAVKPKYLLMENVKALTSKKFMPLFQKWLDTLDDLGYDNYWKVLNAKDYGVPQNRERVFVVSIRKDLNKAGYKFPEPRPLTIRLKDVLESNVDEKYYLSQQIQDRFKFSPKGKNIIGTTAHDFASIGQRDVVYRTEGTMGALTATDYKRPKQIIEPMICASRGRNPDNPSDRTAGAPTEQRLEINSQGISNTLTSVQKDNWVLEASIIKYNVPMQVCVRKNIVDIEKLQKELRAHKTISCKEIADILNIPQTKVEHWFRTDKSFAIPDADIWYMLKALLGITTDKFDKAITEFETKENLFEKSNRCYNVYGISPTLTCTNADEKIIEPKVLQVGNIVNTGNWDNPQRGRIYDPKGCSPALNTMQGGGLEPKITEGYRIRKLTPRECWRLMGVKDEQFDKLSGISNSQLYKMAGNSIVVNVLVYIFANLFDYEDLC